ncbi:unnamed protein product, partial [Ectocarpus sp. 12 AP-2014]
MLVGSCPSDAPRVFACAPDPSTAAAGGTAAHRQCITATGSVLVSLDRVRLCLVRVRPRTPNRRPPPSIQPTFVPFPADPPPPQPLIPVSWCFWPLKAWPLPFPSLPLPATRTRFP